MDIEFECSDIKWMPVKGSDEAAGYDIRAAMTRPVKVFPMDKRLVPTGIKLNLPEGYEAQIRTRSGEALSRGLMVLNSPGTVDSDYTGEIMVILYNTSDRTRTINPGDRIAQMVIKEVPNVNLTVVDSIEKETIRGADGFGSTGRS